MTPAYRIETERLVLRCWDPRDAPLLEDAVASSRSHLLPWMPWAAAAPEPVEATIELLRAFRRGFDAGEDFVYGVLSRDEQEVLGGSGLHTRVGDAALEIGYWLRASAVGRGLATETAAALTRVAFACFGVDRVEIRVDPENEASCRVARRLGYERDALLRRRLPPHEPGGPRRDALVFTLFADGLAGSPAASAPLAAYDAAGRRLL